MGKRDNMEYPGYYLSKRGILWTRHNNSSKLRSYIWKKKLLSIDNKNGRTRAIVYNSYHEKVHINIAREVAKLYVPNPNPEFFNVVCHKDNNPKNNHYKNLYWGTQKMNMQQMVSDGRSCIGQKNGRSILNDQQTRQIITQYILHQGLMQQRLADQFNVSKSCIKHIIKKFVKGGSIWAE